MGAWNGRNSYTSSNVDFSSYVMLMLLAGFVTFGATWIVLIISLPFVLPTGKPVRSNSNRRYR